MTVDGAESTWTNGASLYLGFSGAGTLHITDGGIVDVGVNLHLGYVGTGVGTLNLAGGTLWMHGGALAKGDGTGIVDLVLHTHHGWDPCANECGSHTSPCVHRAVVRALASAEYGQSHATFSQIQDQILG